MDSSVVSISRSSLLLRGLVNVIFGAIVFFGAMAPLAHAIDITTIWDGHQLVQCGQTDPDQCNWEQFIALANRIIVFLVWLSAFLVVFAFCYAGFLYMTAFGEMGKIEQAHSIFKTALIGFFFVLCGWLIIATVLRVLQVDTNVVNTIDFNNVKTIQGQPR